MQKNDNNNKNTQEKNAKKKCLSPGYTLNSKHVTAAAPSVAGSAQLEHLASNFMWIEKDRKDFKDVEIGNVKTCFEHVLNIVMSI